jgi:carbon starvation protein
LFGRTGGAATLAVGMAQIFASVTNGRWLDLWYHFAIMFEALFILTTIDAGTRVGRYILQDFLGHLWKPLGDTRKLSANLLASVLLVGAWGWFLIQGVRDPLGGINSLWPLFGIANQMLAAIALCLGTTIILKMQLGAPSTGPARKPADKLAGTQPGAPKGRPAFAFITLIPLVWLLAVTFTAGAEKIWHSDPRIGFLAQAKVCAAKISAMENRPLLTKEAAEKWDAEHKNEIADYRKNRSLLFNNLLDAVVTGTFLMLVSVIVLLSLREWFLLLSKRKVAVLHEAEPVWLPDYALKESGPNLRTAAGAAAIALGLAKELSGETQFERAKQAACACEQHSDPNVFKQVTEERFNGVRRCC